MVFLTMIFHPLLSALLFPAMIVLVIAGRHSRKKDSEAVTSTAIEGAVFALFGLLLAFTFSGALTRYDDHRKILVEEANDITVAYLRLSLLPPAAQPAIRQDFRQYAKIREHRFDHPPGSPQYIEAGKETYDLLGRIWTNTTAAAASPGANPDAIRLLIPALNAMIDITATRKNAYYMHPPAIIFILLFLLAGACAFMAGYSMDTDGRHHWLYTAALAFTVSFTIYVTLEVEYPLYGLIHLPSQQEVYDDVYTVMQYQ
jgi:FtsH-binding integral membrane protein